MKKQKILALVLAFGLFSLVGCTPTETPDYSIEGTIKIVSDSEQDTAFDTMANEFTKKYPKAKVEYEFLQNYKTSLLKRLSEGANSDVDLFTTTNIQSTSPYLPYFLNLFDDEIDLSQTFPGLINNFTYKGETADGAKALYAIPQGAEIRGLYVNKTLLQACNIPDVPLTKSALLSACETLVAQGFIPLQGNPATFAQHFLYPTICNSIANAEDYDAVYAQVNAHQAGVSELFREPLQFLYDLVANHYYDYATSEKRGLFTDGTLDTAVKLLLNINGTAEYPNGQVAFWPAVFSNKSTIDKYKDGFNSTINYEFVMAPTAEDGGFAYMSPADGLAVNKNSAHLDIVKKYLNFFFEPDHIKMFAKKHNIIPNTADAYDTMKEQFNIPENHMSELGKVTFDYDFYAIMNRTLTKISKANNPKYCDQTVNPPVMYPFSTFLSELETNLVAGKIV
jgi:ABC-type glycerol-3-phosphate transport system substrate-binding protein